jgi:hypothetical protein
MNTQTNHAGLASVTVGGIFTVIIVSLITHQPMPPWLPPLLGTGLGSVLGYYFGASGAYQSSATLHGVVNTLAERFHTAPAAPPAPPASLEAPETIKED